jgi:glycosyltransferase 2 family protein
MTTQILHAFDVLSDHLASIGFGALAAAVGLHMAKIVARTRSWRNILAAAYPRADVRWRGVFGSYVSGAAVNALLPARGGDVLKLYLIKRRIDGSAYPTLVATLAVDTLFDVVVSAALLAWALRLGVLPGLDVLPRLRSIDWSWADRNPTVALAVGAVAAAAGLTALIWLRRRLRTFARQLREGGAILRQPGRYLRSVVSWQLADWLLRLATITMLLRAFGLPASLHNALLVQVTQSLSTLLPLTPAGIGTEQGLLAYVFSGRAPATRVLSFSVGMKLALMAVNLVIGFAAIALMLRTLRWRRVIAGDAARVVERSPRVSRRR